MPVLHLVRHGHAAAGWDADADPGLDPLGERQAHSAAALLGAELAPRRILSSPLRRALETAAPLARAWGADVAVAPAFGEIPSPTDDLARRGAWLRSALVSRWDDLDEQVAAWRSSLLEAVASASEDQVVFTHFVAINAVVGAASGDPAVTVFLPANASITVVEVAPEGVVTVRSRGAEAPPEVG